MKKLGKFLKWLFVGTLVFILVFFTASEITIAVFARQASESPLHDYETVEVDGHSIAYRELISEGDQTLVIVHGFLGSSYEYVDLFKNVDEEAFNTRVIAIDTPGFGMSDKPADYLYTSANQASTLLKVTATMGIDSFALLGHSMGGEIAQHMAATSERVEKLLLLDPVAPDDEIEPVRLPSLLLRVFFQNYWLQRLGFNTAPVEPLPREIFRPAMIQNHSIPSDILQQFSLEVDTEYPIDFAETIDIPVFIAYGSLDTWTPPELLDTYLTLYPQAESAIIEEAGHLPYLEKPDITSGLIVNFLNNE